MTRYLLDADAVIDFFKGFSSTVELIQDLYQQGTRYAPALWSWLKCARA